MSGNSPTVPTAPSAPSIGAQAATAAQQRDWSLGEAVRSFPFWCITIGHLALGTALFMINTHAIAHFVAVGYEKLAASFYFGLIGFIRIGATILWGSVSDRIGRSKAYGLAVFVTALGVSSMIAMTFDAPLWLVYMTIALYGIGHSAGNPTYGAVISDIFFRTQNRFDFWFFRGQFRPRQRLWLVDRRLSFRCYRHLCWSFAVCLACFVISALAIHACVRWHNREMASVHR